MRNGRAFDLGGCRLMVSGAASGIGAAVGLIVSGLGGEVILMDAVEASATEEMIRSRGGVVSGVVCDVSDRRQVDEAVKSLGRIDALICCAGICPWTDWMDDHWESSFDRVMDVNVRGAINCARAVLPSMISRKFGRIVLVGSVAGQMGGLSSDIPYVVSKGGVHSMVRWLARRGAPHNVLVNGVAPGPVATPLTSGRPIDVSGIPLGRFAEASEVAWPIAFLCSREASYITGAIVAVNGGLYMA